MSYLVNCIREAPEEIIYNGFTDAVLAVGDQFQLRGDPRVFEVRRRTWHLRASNSACVIHVRQLAFENALPDFETKRES